MTSVTSVVGCFSRILSSSTTTLNELSVLRNANTDQFVIVTIDGSQNVVTLATRRGLHENSCKASNHSEEGSHHEMSRIDKEELSLAFPRSGKLG